MSVKAGFAIINGQPLHPDTGHSLDGLQRNNSSAVTSTVQDDIPKTQSIESKPSAQTPSKTQRRSIDGLGGPRRPIPQQSTPTKPQSAPRPQEQHKEPPQPNTVKSKTTDKQLAKNQTKDNNLIQSRTLSNRRADRARRYRQHHAISKFGQTKHSERQPDPSQPVQLSPKFKPSEELAVSAIAQQIYRPRGAIGRHLAIHDNESAPEAEEQPVEDKQQKLFSWLNPSAKFMKIATTAMSVLVLSAYVAYLNAPNISVRIAASRAGINAQLPGYTPSGFALDGPVEYETGKIVLNFASNSDERNFTIAQEESRWNSETLRENSVANQTSDYETIRRGGLTVYIWNGSNASWVNQGIKYTLDGDSQLSEEQITQIATSL